MYLNTISLIQFFEISILNSNFKNFASVFQTNKIFINKIIVSLTFLSDSVFYFFNCQKKYVNYLNVSYLRGNYLPLALCIQNFDSKLISMVL